MTPAPTAPIRVLLVDDHRTILWGLERLIESGKPNMQVVGSATNSDEALKAVESTSPDVILLDLDLGTENGLDAIPLLIAASSAKVLVLTGLRDESVHHRAVLAGARGVIEKKRALNQS